MESLESDLLSAFDNILLTNYIQLLYHIVNTT